MWCHLKQNISHSRYLECLPILSLIPSVFQCIPPTSHKQFHCIRNAFLPTDYNIPIASGSIFVQQSTTFPLHQEAFCPTVYNIPITSGSILSTSLQHSHCIRKHCVQQSVTFPMDQNVFRPQAYNIPTARERSFTHDTTLKLHRSLNWNLFKTI
jgi:hypothetical protein